MTTTMHTVADVLAALATKVEAGTLDLSTAIEEITGAPCTDEEHHAMGSAEADRRDALELAVFDALGISPEGAAEFRQADAALAVVRAAQNNQSAASAQVGGDHF